MVNGVPSGSSKGSPWLKLAQIFLYLLLQLVFFPAQLLGFIWYVWKVRTRSIPKGISGTADIPLLSRLRMHSANTRPDLAAAALARHLPALNPFIVASFESIGVASRWSGFTGVLVAYPALRPASMLTMVQQRTEFFDRHIGDAVKGEHGAPVVHQVVILGAGWDTRAWGLLRDVPGLCVFEVDMPATQRAKRKAVCKAGLDPGRVTFVECDFHEKTWPEALKEHGFNSNLPSFVLCEGLFYYLKNESVQDTLKAIASLPSGSQVAFDYISEEFLQRLAASKGAWEPLRMVGRIYNEPFLSGIPTLVDAEKNVQQFLEVQGLLKLKDFEVMGQPGKPFGGLVCAEAD